MYSKKSKIMKKEKPKILKLSNIEQHFGHSMPYSGIG